MVALIRVPASALVFGAALSASFARGQSLPQGSLSRGPGSVEGSVLVVVTRARQMATLKLRSEGCRRVFSEFRDLPGRTLDEALKALDESPLDHLSLMEFRDGTDQATCRRSGVYAFTSIGASTVFVCPSFILLAKSEPKAAANLLIHEELHSLGAGEAPMPGLPTSQDITNHIERRCGR